MPKAFVWFHNRSKNPKQSIAFYSELLGWKSADGPPGLTLFTGDEGPFAGIGEPVARESGWLPYVQVDDVEAATARAKKLGAELVEARTQGPAGDYTVIRDPGGATVALWQKA
jgi:predicted enzyme related to lactoylglutathione lyase